MSLLTKIENGLGEAYKGTPKLSIDSKKSIVEVWPWVALVFGILQLWVAFVLWHWGHNINRTADRLNAYYGGTFNHVAHLNAFYWLSLAVLLADAVILLAAFPKLRTRSKAGWRLLFYGSILNLLYGVFSAFNNYGHLSSLITQVLVSGIVFYFLFQIREQYHSAK